MANPPKRIDSDRLWSDVMESPKVLEVTDRRRNHRYELEAEVRFYWQDLERIRRQEEGSIRDISQFGVFVVTNSHPPIGTTLRLEVLLHSPATQNVRLEAQGQVIRVETADPARTQCGFAVATNAMKVFDRTLHVAG